MVKKLAVMALLLGVVVCISVSAYSEDNAAQPADTSASGGVQQAAPEKDALAADEEMLPAEEGIGEGVITGDVTVLEISAGSITIKGGDGAEKAFSVVEGETILWKGIEDIKLSDIKKGDKAEVGYYTDDAGKLIASWVDVLVPEQPVAAGGQTDAPVTEAAPAVPGEE